MSRSLWLFAVPFMVVLSNGFAQQRPAAPAPTPSPQATPAQASPDAARFRAEIAKIEGAMPGIADRGAALFLLAKRYAQVGELPKALTLLKECIGLNEGFDPSESPALQPLRSNPEFQQMVEQVRRNYPPVHHASVAFTVQEKDLFPEGLAYDSSKRVFYMGSMHHKKIVMITQAGEVSDFVKPGVYGLLELGGIKVDPADHSVWAASDEDGRSELLHFDSQGKLLERYPPTEPGSHILNDLELGAGSRHQEIYVTDTDANQVYYFDRQRHTFTPMVFHRPLFYPNGITLAGNGNLLYVADILGVIQVDLNSGATQDVNPGKSSTLAGIDGLYWYKGSLLGVQYGTNSDRVARWRLSPDGRTVTATEILEHRTPLVSFPTTGAIAGGKFYFIANTGIANLKDHKIVDSAKLEPIHIAVVPLDK